MAYPPMQPLQGASLQNPTSPQALRRGQMQQQQQRRGVPGGMPQQQPPTPGMQGQGGMSPLAMLALMALAKRGVQPNYQQQPQMRPPGV